MNNEKISKLKVIIEEINFIEQFILFNNKDSMSGKSVKINLPSPLHMMPTPLATWPVDSLQDRRNELTEEIEKL